MNRLPGDTSPVVFWRVDDRRHAKSWDSGEGARLTGGRWNPRGVAAVYCSLDPSTAILEVAVHKGFDTLNRVPHVLTAAVLRVPWDDMRVVQPEDAPNARWLYPAMTSAPQQAFGGQLLRSYDFVVLPSAVSRRSWNLLFEPHRAAGKYELRAQEPLDLDPRLSPSA